MRSLCRFSLSLTSFEPVQSCLDTWSSNKRRHGPIECGRGMFVVFCFLARVFGFEFGADRGRPLRPEIRNPASTTTAHGLERPLYFL